MPQPALLPHLLLAVFLLLLSAALTRFMLSRACIMDIPNARSSHAQPTPKSGGVAIVAAFVCGLAGMAWLAGPAVVMQGYFLGFVFAVLLVAAISFYDDVKHKPFLVKLVAQLVAAGVVMAAGVVLDELTLPWFGRVELGWLGYTLTFLWIVGLTNAFNFMDGLDGLAGGVAFIAAVFFCFIALGLGSDLVYMVSYILAAGSLGFLLYNFPPARIFMGDVGSAFLGFTFAVLAVIAARYDQSHVSFWVMPLLLGHFIYDTAFTFMRRLLRGEKVTDAHRDHLYQLFSRLGYGHLPVTLFYYGLSLLQGGAALWLAHAAGTQAWLAFVPVVSALAVYTMLVLRAAAGAEPHKQ
ncbi:MAG: MraY family glycosyltransferase [Pseudomonadota bacterium]